MSLHNGNLFHPPVPCQCLTPRFLAGYKVYYGLLSDQYSYSVDVGNRTSYTLSNLQDRKIYYFAATAYDREVE